ncbi:oxidoreductase [Massilia sp. Leaf139]|uniref:oxidoreductase n=1 Tax=Massilia sp. Leaf139 TaxID=1736272 RepID=UPI0007000B01|nr:oxidoreductase [Massilia sp. Leaf139]KQQ87302.1 short-chain dehydrogenase [Massilia sp. Leaf139]
MRKTWFITGAGRGIGADIARAALAHGDNVVATGRSLAQLQERFADADPARLLPLALDVAIEAQALPAVEAAVERFGRIDVLVNNAAYGQMGNLEEVPMAAVARQFDVNVYGVMHMLQAVLPVMRRQRAGHVINISSVGGLLGFSGASVYCATKYAIEGLSASLATELQPFGIHVTAVEPGFFRTEFLDASSVRYGAKTIDDYAAQGTVEDAYSPYRGKQLGDPVKLAALVVRLAGMETPPQQLLAGSDAVAMTQAALAARRAGLDEWRVLSESTDHAA